MAKVDIRQFEMEQKENGYISLEAAEQLLKKNGFLEDYTQEKQFIKGLVKKNLVRGVKPPIPKLGTYLNKKDLEGWMESQKQDTSYLQGRVKDLSQQVEELTKDKNRYFDKYFKEKSKHDVALDKIAELEADKKRLETENEKLQKQLNEKKGRGRPKKNQPVVEQPEGGQEQGETKEEQTVPNA